MPVLLEESITALQLQGDGTYVDATFGGGGHSKEIVKQLGVKGHLYSFDQDVDASSNLLSENENFTFVPNNFRYIKQFLKLHGVRQVDGILADLGVSSHQLDEADRGFSHRFDAQLDMRMNQRSGATAADLLNEKSVGVHELQLIFSQYGEVRNAKTLAQAIVSERDRKPILTIGDFINVLNPCVRGHRPRYLSQVFQALRIEVNDELGALKAFLQDAVTVLKPGGRLVVIAYHSLEDRLVKQFIKTGSFSREVEKDFYGNVIRPLDPVSRKAIVPTPEEIERNPRARSAKMRVAEKRAE